MVNHIKKQIQNLHISTSLYPTAVFDICVSVVYNLCLW